MAEGGGQGGLAEAAGAGERGGIATGSLRSGSSKKERS